jgi:GntR family transcriptional regulator
MSKVRHGQIASDLNKGIANGRYPVGSLLPTELELCAQYDTSRHTVRAALKALQELGLVSRRKNVGTRVEAATASSRFRQSLVSVEDLVQFGATHLRSIQAVEEIVASSALANTLRCVAGSRWLHIAIVRMCDGAHAQPLGWTDVYVDAMYADIAELVRRQPQALTSTLIEQRYGRGIAEIQQDIQAVAIPDSLADVLCAEAGTPALQIVRRYLDASGEAFETSVTIHPADRYTFSTQLSRSRDPAG